MRSLTTAGAVTTSLLFLATPATAAPVDQGAFHDVFTEQIDDLCGVAGQHDADYQGRFVAKRNGADGLVYYGDTASNVDVWTNLETGKKFTEVSTGSGRDRKVTDNGNGTLTVLVQGTGSYRSYDNDMKLFLRDPGMSQFEILVDDAGTPGDPFDDEFIDFLGVVRDSTGLNELEGRDFCTDFHLVTD